MVAALLYWIGAMCQVVSKAQRVDHFSFDAQRRSQTNTILETSLVCSQLKSSLLVLRWVIKRNWLVCSLRNEAEGSEEVQAGNLAGDFRLVTALREMRLAINGCVHGGELI